MRQGTRAGTILWSFGRRAEAIRAAARGLESLIDAVSEEPQERRAPRLAQALASAEALRSEPVPERDDEVAPYEIGRLWRYLDAGDALVRASSPPLSRRARALIAAGVAAAIAALIAAVWIGSRPEPFRVRASAS